MSDTATTAPVTTTPATATATMPGPSMGLAVTYLIIMIVIFIFALIFLISVFRIDCTTTVKIGDKDVSQQAIGTFVKIGAVLFLGVSLILVIRAIMSLMSAYENEGFCSVGKHQQSQCH
jgi:hypothetical protein